MKLKKKKKLPSKREILEIIRNTDSFGKSPIIYQPDKNPSP